MKSWMAKTIERKGMSETEPLVVMVQKKKKT